MCCSLKASPNCPEDGTRHDESSICFEILPEELSGTDARLQCLKRGGNLTLVKSDTLRNLMANKVSQWVLLCFFKLKFSFVSSQNQFFFSKIVVLIFPYKFWWMGRVQIITSDVSINTESKILFWWLSEHLMSCQFLHTVWCLIKIVPAVTVKRHGDKCRTFDDYCRITMRYMVRE